MNAPERARLGARVRATRRRAGLTQAQLAQKLGISASYLNLIENDKRPLTAPVLIALARELDVDLDAFAADEEARSISDLMEAFGDPLFDDDALTNQDVRDLASTHPVVARAVGKMYRALVQARETNETLAARVVDGEVEPTPESRPVSPTEDVSDFLEDHNNHFPGLEAAADGLWRGGGLSEDDLYTGLVAHLDKQHGVRVEVLKDPGAGALRRFYEDERRLVVSELLPPRSRHFQLAHQIALIEHGDLIDGVVAEDPALTSDASRRLARVTLANYFAAAVIMPYGRFLAAAREVRYDIELLGHRFRTSYEQICHRLTTLRRPGQEGVPFHFVRVDVAGNISKRFSGSGIQFARYSGACPRWNVFAAFLTPGMIRIQISQMPDGTVYFCVARTVRSTGAGFHAPQATFAVGLGCRLEHASELVYADGIDLVHAEGTAVPIGVTCRLCDRLDCTQRAFPPLAAPLIIDPNVRGPSFYAPAAVREETVGLSARKKRR